MWTFLLPLASAAPCMLPERRPALLAPLGRVVAFVRAGLEAAPDLSALEGSAANPEGRIARVGRVGWGGGGVG